MVEGAPDELPERYAERSPSTHVAELRAPLLIVHGENDPRCPIGPVRQFVDAAQALGLPVRLRTVEGEGHGSTDAAKQVEDLALGLAHLDRVFGRR